MFHVYTGPTFVIPRCLLGGVTPPPQMCAPASQQNVGQHQFRFTNPFKVNVTVRMQVVLTLFQTNKNAII